MIDAPEAPPSGASDRLQDQVRASAILVGHGLGYSLHYLLRSNDWRKQVYGLRSILNSGLFFTTGKRLTRSDAMFFAT